MINEWSIWVSIGTAANILTYYFLPPKKSIQVINMIKICCFLLSTIYLADYIATDLHLWNFNKTWGINIINCPIENSIFVVGMVFNILIIRSLVSHWLDSNDLCRDKQEIQHFR